MIAVSAVEYRSILLLAGVALLIAAWVPAYTQRRPLSVPIVLVATGALLFTVPGMPDVDPREHLAVAEHLTEFGVLVALLGAGLKLDRRIGLHRWEHHVAPARHLDAAHDRRPRRCSGGASPGSPRRARCCSAQRSRRPTRCSPPTCRSVSRPWRRTDADGDERSAGDHGAPETDGVSDVARRRTTRGRRHRWRRRGPGAEPGRRAGGRGPVQPDERGRAERRARVPLRLRRDRDGRHRVESAGVGRQLGRCSICSAGWSIGVVRRMARSGRVLGRVSFRPAVAADRPRRRSGRVRRARRHLARVQRRGAVPRATGSSPCSSPRSPCATPSAVTSTTACCTTSPDRSSSSS